MVVLFRTLLVFCYNVGSGYLAISEANGAAFPHILILLPLFHAPTRPLLILIQDHDYAWGLTEATATEWAKTAKADVLASAPATRQELNWYQFTVLFRWIIRHEPETILLLTPIFLFKADDFVYWLTDVTQSQSTICGSEAAWAVSGALSLSLPGSVLTLPGQVVDFLTAVFSCGRAFFESS